jgi:hypothetical protein
MSTTPRRRIGEWRLAPLILDLGTRWRSVISFTSRPLYLQGKSPWYPLDTRMGGPHRRSGRGGTEKNSQPLTGLEPPITQPVALRHPGSTVVGMFLKINQNPPSVTNSYHGREAYLGSQQSLNRSRNPLPPTEAEGSSPC